ncbi:MAG: hypothetical protein ACREL3_10675 [Gemmatimonadales bacterium]
MPRHLLVLALLLTGAAPGLSAQTEYYARLGAVGATNLLHDAIVGELTVRQSIAPMIALGGSLPIGSKGYRANLEATFATGKFHRNEGGSTFDIGTLRTGTILLGLEGPVGRQFRWRAALGAIRYFPADHQGIFLSGGTTRFLAGAGADYRRPVLPKWDLMTSLRYDFHRFRTETLQERGFSQYQAVSRVSLSIGLSRGLR